MSLGDRRWSRFIHNGVVRRVRRRRSLALRPFWRLGPLRILPRSLIAQRTSALAVAAAAEDFREVLLGHLAEEFLFVAGAEDVDFLDGDGVEEALDDAEDAGEAPGGVDEVKLAEAFGVVVLGDGGCLFDVAVDRTDFGDAHAFQVHYRAAGF